LTHGERIPIDWTGYFEARTVLVTGGAGLIGRALVEQLLRSVDRIVCVDLKPKPEKWEGESKIDYLSMDANVLTAEQLAPFGIGVVFHLAATFERTAETPKFWGENYHHNVRLSHHLGSLYSRLPTVERVVFASSYLIYDSDHYTFAEPQERAVTVDEQFSVKPRNICGAAKLLHETELEFLSTFNRFTVVYPRIFRVYGPGECGRLGGTVINRWINQLLDRPDEPLEVYGQEARFDYVFSDEVATGLLMIAASSHSGVVNLGRGEARAVEEVLALLKEHFPGMSCRYGETRFKYEACQADMTLFEEVTGWCPGIRLEEGLRRCIDLARARGRDVHSEWSNSG
jgi:carbamoyl-phosphate synthase large subunit